MIPLAPFAESGDRRPLTLINIAGTAAANADPDRQSRRLSQVRVVEGAPWCLSLRRRLAGSDGTPTCGDHGPDADIDRAAL